MDIENPLSSKHVWRTIISVRNTLYPWTEKETTNLRRKGILFYFWKPLNLKHPQALLTRRKY